LNSKSIKLQDDRTFSYAEYGVPNGYPIIYCHGSQSSRLEMHHDVSFATDNNLRIITIDRPGHGLSDFNPKGSIQSFAIDVAELTTHLNIKKYSVIGMSAGAPFAMGIALAHKNQIDNLSIVSGFAPFNDKSKSYLKKEVKILLQLAKSIPLLLRFLLKIQRFQLKKNPSKALKQFLKVMSEPDQLILKNPAVLEVIERMFTEAFRNGSKGVAYEISKILVRDWNININEIDVPTTIYQGKEDNNVPFAWAESLQAEIPNSQLKVYPKEGHLLVFEHAEEIFLN